VTVLGAVTDDGDSFYYWTEENLATRHGIWSLEALEEEFGEELVVFLDHAGYFYTRDLWKHVSGERATKTVRDGSAGCVCGEPLDLWYFPPKLPELNPLEGVGSTPRMVQTPVHSRSPSAETTDSARTSDG
jgi:hypothetical protein